MAIPMENPNLIKPRNDKGQFIKGIAYTKGKKASKETRLKQSISKKKAGIIPPSRKGISPTNKGIRATPEQRRRLSIAQKIRFQQESVWNKGKRFFQISGENHHRWKGGTSTVNEAIRKSIEYKNWKRAVLARDNYICILCENIDHLEVDHIKPFAYFPEVRFDINNGRTLCHDCHVKTPTYKNKSYKNKYGKSELKEI